MEDLDKLRQMFASLAYEKTVGTGWLERLRDEGDEGDPTTGSVSGRARAQREREAAQRDSAHSFEPAGRALNPFLLGLRGRVLAHQNNTRTPDTEPRREAA